MHRSSETIGVIAAALAKAQAELVNPEKTLTATVKSPFPREEAKTFRYASLASGLDIIRKNLGTNEIATIQTTAIDQEAGLINLTTLLAHASGEWISSIWPVCTVSETATPHRMGAALTYARRYALFALVGLAGEDDVDAPEPPLTGVDCVHSKSNQRLPEATQRRNTIIHKSPALEKESSAKLREQLLEELKDISGQDALAIWAHRRFKDKNTLNTDDARIVETACHKLLQTYQVAEQENYSLPKHNENIVESTQASQSSSFVTPRTKPVRQRSKAHLAFVAAQPCLICRRTPCDAHHLKFAQPKALGRKVSDEFTVPLCREHHHELHRHGNEAAWWANLKLAPLEVAKELWRNDPARTFPGHYSGPPTPAGAMP
jgi:hypothetical protein